MNLAKSLKIKNRNGRDIKTRIANFFSKFSKEESFKSEGEAATVFQAKEKLCEQEFDDILKNAGENAGHKANIARANEGIWDKIFLMSEYKSLLAKVREAYIGAGSGIHESRRRASALNPTATEQVEYKFFVFSIDKKAEVEAKLIRLIDDLQDEIDAYNATVSI